MRKLFWISVVVLTVCGVSRSDSVKDFTDHLASVNGPMPSGVVQFEIAVQGVRDGKLYAYVDVGTYTFNAERGLLHKELVSGEPHIALALKNGPKLATDSYTAIDAMGWSAYSPSANTVMRYEDQRMSLAGLSLLAGDPLGFDVRKAAGEGACTLDGGDLSIQFDGNLIVILTADSQGRITRFDQVRGGKHQTYELADHIQIDGRWLPQRVTFRQEADADWRTTEYTMTYLPGTPDEGELDLPAPAELPTRVLSLVDGVPVTRPVSTSRRFCEPGYYEEYLGSMCGGGLNQCVFAAEFWTYCCNEFCQGETVFRAAYKRCCAAWPQQGGLCVQTCTLVGSTWDNCIIDIYPRGLCIPLYYCKVDATTHHDAYEMTCGWE